MAVTASLVKELRERTGLGMMECKKALVETDGDIDVAIENLRKSGQAKAAKKAGRVAAEGAVNIAIAEDAKKAVLVEVNSETDFVARDENFIGFATKVADITLALGSTEVEQITASEYAEGQSVEEARQALIQKIGENIQVRRAVAIEGDVVAGYTHNNKIGVVVALDGGDDTLARDVAMHVAASNPLVVNEDQVDANVLDKEREIFKAQAAESGKPEEIVNKMVEGRIKKFLKEVTLVEQPFVKNPDLTVGKLVKDAGASIIGFQRLELGEGIEKEEVDFAQEVMEQAGKA